MIYHEESLKCQGKLDVSNSIIFYQKKKKIIMAPLRIQLRSLEMEKAAFSEANSRPR